MLKDFRASAGLEAADMLTLSRAALMLEVASGLFASGLSAIGAELFAA